jgi:hypothetical protein
VAWATIQEKRIEPERSRWTNAGVCTLSTMGCNTKMEIAENTQASFSSGRPYSNSSKIAGAKSEKCRVLAQPAKPDSLVAKECSDEGRKRERGKRVKNLVDKRLSNLLLTVQNSGLQLVQLYHAPRGDFCSSRWPLFSQYTLSRRNRMACPVIARCAPAIVAHSNGCLSSNWPLICGTN